eukprot:5713095-Amphidinium_carterae.1
MSDREELRTVDRQLESRARRVPSYTLLVAQLVTFLSRRKPWVLRPPKSDRLAATSAQRTLAESFHSMVCFVPGKALFATKPAILEQYLAQAKDEGAIQGRKDMRPSCVLLYAQDVIAVLEEGGGRCDLFIIPMVGVAADVYMVDSLATQ